jgi:hypothetical protein
MIKASFQPIPPMRFLLSLLPVLWLMANARGAEFERSYWVWHRATPLTPGEKEELTGQNVKTLFWSIGEMEQRGGVWVWKSAPTPLAPLTPEFRVVPVVRLNPAARVPFPPESLPALVEKLKAVASPAGDLQIDYDSPNRLLPEYAAALREIRRVLPRISITALADWPRLASFADLARSVSEITPMLYDLQGDPTGVGPETPPPPILDPSQAAGILRTWKACPTPWRAGFPTFARLTVFDSAGHSRGQIPNWTWEDFCFHPRLRTLGPTQLGVTLLRADADTRVAGTAVAGGEIVASRYTDRAALAQMAAQAQENGATGVTYFRWPDGTDPAGLSPSDLGKLTTPSAPQLVLRPTTEGGLELINNSAFDLPPRLAGEKGDLDRGYALEIDMPAPVFREALRGDFWRVTSHTDPDAKTPTPALVPLATRLTFWFGDLRAGAVRRTGLLQLAPGATLATVRYRILHCEGATSWKPIPIATPQP